MPEFRNRFVIFPTGKQAEALAYKAWGDLKNQEAAVALGLSAEDNSVLGLLQNDAYGQWVTTYFGPYYTIDGVNVIEEPEDGPAMRAEGVLVDDWTRPAPSEGPM